MSKRNKKSGKYHGNKQKSKQKKNSNAKIPDSIKNKVVNLLEKPSQYVTWAHSLVWAYIFQRLLFTDLDLNYFTALLSISKTKYIFYRSTIFGIIILVVWSIIGNKKFYKGLVFFILFPFYPFLVNILYYTFWKLPKALFHRGYDFLLFSYFDNLIAIIVKFRETLCKGMLLLIAFIVIFGFRGKVLFVPFIIFVFLQLLHLYKRYIETYAPIKVFQIKLPSKQSESEFSKTKFDESLKNATKGKEENIEIAEMEYFLLMSEFSRLFHQKMEYILSSRSYIKGFVFKVIYSFLISILFFSGMNYSIFLIDSSNFAFSGNPGMYEFFYYTFFNIFSEGVDIDPVTKLAKAVRMFGVFTGVIIQLLLLTVYITVRTPRYKENLKYLSSWSQKYSMNVSSYFVEKYGKNPVDGINYLKSTGSELINILDMAKKYLKEK